MLDTQGNVLTAAGWQDICLKFHRAHPTSCARCRQSDRYIVDHLHDGPYVGYLCANGLYDYATPVLIEGEHVASIFTGQFLHEDPDTDYFRRQAAKLGFSEEDYLAALKNVRVVPREKMPAIMAFLSEQAGMLATVGLARLRELEVAEELARKTEELHRTNLQLNLANEAKSRFLATASHDLRQPLQALELYLELLSQRSLHTADPILARAKQCAELLSAQLNDLLDIAKLDSPGTPVQRADCVIQDVLAKIVTSIQPSAAAKGLRLSLVGSSAVVRTDPLLFERLVLNLVSNAVKYTEKGRILLGCRRVRNSVRVEVWDTGIGIPGDSLQTIFEEFHQLDNPSRDRSKGSGLGLAIVERTARLLGLDVSVRSTLGKGSVFAVTFGEAQNSPVPARRAAG